MELTRNQKRRLLICSVLKRRYRAIGKAISVEGIDAMSDEEAADATITAVRKLSDDAGIPANLEGILKEEDIQFLPASAFADACCPGNPCDTSIEEIAELYRGQMEKSNQSFLDSLRTNNTAARKML